MTTVQEQLVNLEEWIEELLAWRREQPSAERTEEKLFHEQRPWLASLPYEERV